MRVKNKTTSRAITLITRKQKHTPRIAQLLTTNFPPYLDLSQPTHQNKTLCHIIMRFIKIKLGLH